MIKDIELSGIWQLSQNEKQEKVPVNVPGTVLSGLLENGKLEDPFYRENEYQTRELFQNDYLFERTFEIEAAVLEEENMELQCEGLDTLAEIELNGISVGTADNMHRYWKFPIKHAVRAGKNEIRIVFKSVLKAIADYQYQPEKEIHSVVCGAVEGNQLIRKAHSMFGWDWGPQLIDAGIFRRIGISAWTGSRIKEIQTHQTHEDGKVSLYTKVCMDQAVSCGEKIRITLREENNTKILASTELVSKKDGTGNVYESEFTVQNPKLWWPNGYGEQPLYILRVILTDEAGHILEEKEKTIGLRTLTVSREKDQWGEEFAFCINGLKIFARGGNYIPEDCLYTRITEIQQKSLLSACVRANYNCIRVWGGGYYPTDAFYDICDHMGLIVWQDLMFACNVYDVTEAFGKNIREEILDNVRRLRHHACLGLWCGNNEIETAWAHWDQFQTESVYLRADYIKQFEAIVPQAVREADPDPFVWPSSPSSGGCFDEPEDENRGDTHYWAVWHGLKPFSDYRNHYFRFCSEFGFQSFPSEKTVKTYTLEEDRNIFSEVMESHQKNPAANGKMLYYLSENFCYPKNFESLLYVTQILQALAMKTGVDHWRRNRGRCMGALYWQVNDDWPVASWSSIDYFGRWKALHYSAKRFFAPVAASMVLDGTKAELWLENETAAVKSCRAVLTLRDLKCNILKTYETHEETGTYSSSAVGIFDLEEDLKQYRKQDVFLAADFYLSEQEGKNEAEVCLSETHLQEAETFVPFKYLNLTVPEIEISVREEEDRYVIILKSDRFAAFVMLELKEADAVFSENNFMMTEKAGYLITLEKKDIFQGTVADAEDLSRQLQIRTLADSY